MKPRHPILQLVFDAAKSKVLISDQKLLEIKSLLKEISILAQARRQEIANYQRIKEISPEIKIEIPEEITINVQDKNGDTALICAAVNGHQTFAHELIEAKANLDTPNKNGNHALICAAAKGHQAIAHELIKAKANLDTPNKNGNTALICAAAKGHQAIAHELIKAKANLDTPNENGNTALICAADKGHQAIAHELIEAKANLDTPNERGNTALILAAANGHQAIAHELIEAKANLDTPNKNGNNALILAAYKGHREIARELIKAGAKLELQNQNGKTALDEAIENKKISTVSLLLSCGALVRNPKKLFDFIQSCDQQDPNVLASLECLCKQLNSHSEVKGIDTVEVKQSLSLISDPQMAQLYMKKLNRLHAAYKQVCFFLLDDSTIQYLPKEVIDLVMDYGDSHFAARSPIVFFQPATVDSALLELKSEISEKTKRTQLGLFDKTIREIDEILALQKTTITKASKTKGGSEQAIARHQHRKCVMM